MRVGGELVLYVMDSSHIHTVYVVMCLPTKQIAGKQ